MLLSSYFPQNLIIWTDQELLEAFRERPSPRYFAVLFDRYWPLVFGMSLKLIQDQNRAKDLCMEIFFKAYLNWQEEEIKNPKAWLRRTTHNHWLSKCRQEEKKKDFLASLTYCSPITSTSFSNEHFIFELLAEELGQLPWAQAVCIQLFYFEQKSYREIALQNNQKEKWVKTQLQNGKRRLRRAIAIRLDTEA